MTDVPLLEVRNLTRRYKLPRQSLLRRAPVLTALEGAAFSLRAGETLGVVGESGSGKSTLARLIMAFEAPDAGEVLFQGRDLHGLTAEELRELRRGFQMVFQDPFGSLNPRRRIGWSIAEPLHANGETENITHRVAETLAQVGLHPADAGKYPHEFSGGQRQRIAIARAIITRPALLVADEAVSALDVSVQAQILNLLMDLQDDLGLGMVFISHDLAVVGSICDRVLVLQHGKTLESGAAVDVLRAPKHPYTKTLLKAAGVRP
ncbi:Glutathione import ATP-binding protein GsiA [Sulfitobacter indolifex]|uniref:ABC transporter ATP-binding protein n=1 Tax=Sulfitobacter indolifex HEL-45 TaxID=391624 RepID=A0ABM9X9R7_9RHOB|nr:ATP-binding cassette domain-containing protein [Sulfitobacter indolifex]EDQ06234.1 ABC transporter ATP-binding protein [Sulfitobacter indolifex HEL-45]UOA20394.1 Glutathione import ATP-binding protein GsiA [Sulfitobacter indolifex]